VSDHRKPYIETSDAVVRGHCRFTPHDPAPAESAKPPLAAPALEGLTPALVLLTILTERLPPPGKTRHGLLVVHGVLAVSLSQDGRFFVFRLSDPGDLDKSPEAVANEVLDLYRKARSRVEE